MKRLIGSLVILVVLVFAGYIGYRMLIRGDSFYEALGAAREKVEDRLPPLRQADREYGRGEYEDAVEHYKEALSRSDSPDAKPSERLSPEKRQHVLRRIADGCYGLAAKRNWPAELVRETREWYERLLRECPDLTDGEKEAVRARMLKLNVPLE